MGLRLKSRKVWCRAPTSCLTKTEPLQHSKEFRTLNRQLEIYVFRYQLINTIFSNKILWLLQEPKPASDWNDTLRANRHYECLHFMPLPIIYGPRGKYCFTSPKLGLSRISLGVEDCLYLYVYVPRKTINPNDLMDVVVHIHGGGFMLGAPQYMAGPEFFMDRDVVVVSLNYRLGILGERML